MLIEDSSGDARLIQEYLKELWPRQFLVLHNTTLSGGKKTLASEEVDIVLSDLNLPDSGGRETFTSLHQDFPDVAIVVLTGTAQDDEMGLWAVRSGAQDFLIKDDLNAQVLGRTISYAIERKQLSRKLEEAQQLAHLGHWELNLGTNELVCSPSLYHIFGIPRSEVFNSFGSYFDLVHPEDLEDLALRFQKLCTEGGSLEIHHRVQLADQVRHIQMRASVRRDRAGKPAVVSGTSQDVTDSYKIEELEREKQIAIRSAQIRQEFLAKTSHEIRTPLNPVLMLTQRLLGTTLTTDQREQLETIKSAGETLLAVVNDILDLSKIEAGKIDFYHEPFQLGKTFSHIRDMQEQFALSRGLQFQMDVDERIPRVLVGDGVRLSQILMNLINNAVKNTTKGAIRVRAEMVKAEESWVEIAFTVKDTGIGIPKDQLDSIFEIFLQIDSDLNRRYKGSGLGLTIVNQLVTLQGGRIEVDSEPNVGSTFTAYLRYEIGNEKADKKNGEGYHSFDLKGLNILLIEDNPLNQMVTQKLLNDYGVLLDIANNGQEGVEMVQAGSYDLVLMDVQMPVMDGYEATRFIRKLAPPLSKIPIIALTANAFTGSDDECLKAGMDDYVSKPIETSTFLDKIAAHALRSTSNGNGKHEDATHVNGSSNGSSNGSAASYPEINPPSPMTAPPYSDLDYLKGICAGDHSLMRKAIEKFLDSLPVVIEQLHTYIRDHNFNDLSKAAHKFKSSAAVMGIHEVKDAMLRMEVIAKEPTLKGELPALMERVVIVLTHAEAELRQTLQSL